jgi:hypothetical protein
MSGMSLISRTPIWYFTCHYCPAESRETIYGMTRLWRVLYSKFGFGIVCLGLSLGLGCARSEPLHPTDVSSSASKQEPPFHPDTDRTSATVPPAVSLDTGMANGLPFRSGSQPRVLPSGTLLTVQLEGTLSSAVVHAGDAFTASVVAPLTVDGLTVLERGTAVTGLVESTHSQADSPGSVPRSGYFRLTLTAITVAGKQVALHTSGLFAREAFQPSGVSSGGADSQSDLRVQKGRRLTFRLTAPVTLDNSNSVADGKYRGSSTE